MDAQRVEVLHITNGDAIVETVAYHLIFHLFPALQAFLNQYLRREREGLLDQCVKFFLIVAETGAQTTKGISGADNDRITQLGCRTARVGGVLDRLALDCLHADLVQALHEQLAVFRIHNGLHGRSQHLDMILLQDTTLIERDATVQRRLSAKSQKDAVGTLLGDHLLDEEGCHGQEIDRIRHAIRRLHRRDIGVDQDGLNSLLLDGFQCLAA